MTTGVVEPTGCHIGVDVVEAWHTQFNLTTAQKG